MTKNDEKGRSTEDNDMSFVQNIVCENSIIEIIVSDNNGCSPQKNLPDKSVIKKERKRSWRTKFGGILFAVLAAFLFSMVTCLVKLLPNYHPICIAFWRQFGNIVPSIPLVWYYYRKQQIFDGIWPLTCQRQEPDQIENWSNVRGLAIRGFLGSSCVMLKFYSLEYLTIADSTVIQYGGPIFIIILAHFVLKEKCGVVPILIALWSLFGVAVIARPPFLTGADGFDIGILIGTGIVMVLVLFQGIVMILVRQMRKIHYSVMTLFFGVWGLAQGGLVSVSFGVLTVPTGFQDIMLMTILSLCAFGGQICSILALKMEEAGTVSLARTSNVIFVFLLQSTILHKYADIFSVIGAIIVLSGVIVIAFRKWLSVQNENSAARRTFRLLLI